MSTKLSQDVSIGENLRILRKRAGYSQERAAAQLELMGISMSREIISQMESGHHNIRISVLLAFKQVYEVDSFDDFSCNRKKAVTDEIKAGANWNRSESQKTPAGRRLQPVAGGGDSV